MAAIVWRFDTNVWLIVGCSLWGFGRHGVLNTRWVSVGQVPRSFIIHEEGFT